MKRDSIFWLCIVVNMLVLMLSVILKPEVHLLPAIAMYIIIKINLFLQIGVGVYGLWISSDPKLFSLFLKIYAPLLIIYVLLKIPALNLLDQYFIIKEALFTPFPFVLGWIVNKAFYQNETTKD